MRANPCHRNKKGLGRDRALYGFVSGGAVFVVFGSSTGSAIRQPTGPGTAIASRSYEDLGQG